jgi:hypothetical protein
MKLETLQDRINSAKAKIEKKQSTIEKKTLLIEKKTSQLNKMGFTVDSDSKEVYNIKLEAAWLIWDISYLKQDIICQNIK